MDPFTIATGIAGFVPLAIEIGKILKEYISQFKEAPKDAQTILTEITALRYVLQQLTVFLRKEEINGINFHETSALCSVINICGDKIKDLHAKLTKFRAGNFKDRLRWPFHRQECLEVAETLHHCAQTIEFSLTITNW
ncbi:hypothetical protein BDZ91DRAFT_330752 [Kalaharituber pfeilii]|nr:hypothetical protein BDZ91DRAFT_330752 [Kalaharituber pfeilii]